MGEVGDGSSNMPCFASRHADSTRSWVARRKRTRPEKSGHKEGLSDELFCENFKKPHRPQRGQLFKDWRMVGQKKIATYCKGKTLTKQAACSQMKSKH